jgi:hypothetical protein
VVQELTGAAGVFRKDQVNLLQDTEHPQGNVL